MKNAAFTFVQNDMVILELWCKYYSRYFQNLYACCFNTKDEYGGKLEELKNKYNLIASIHPFDQDSPPQSNDIIKLKQMELLQTYEWVLFSNCDEYVMPSFSCDRGLDSFMRRCGMQWAWCIGYDVIQEEDELPLDYSQPILCQRKSWIKNPNINKVLLSKIPLSWNEGQHQLDQTHGIEPKEMGDMGLTLVHLKHADLQAQGRDFGPVITRPWDCIMGRLSTRTTIPRKIKELL